jgi:hypothetical protein
MTEEEFANLPDDLKRSLSVSGVYRRAIDEAKSSLKADMDFITSASRSLLVAHGAGLITAVQLIASDHVERLGRVSLFGALFSLGFLLAAAASFFSYYAQGATDLRHAEKNGNSFTFYLISNGNPARRLVYCTIFIDRPSGASVV